MNLAGQLWAWEFEGWKPESDVLEDRLLHPRRPVQAADVFRGPDVKEFFSSILVNSLENFPVGSMKHGIYCNEDGLMTAHAILQRNDEHEYRFYAGQPWPHYKLLAAEGGSASRWSRRRGTCSRSPGPRRWRRSSARPANRCRDIAFLRFRDAKIDGPPSRSAASA